jgi:hypothetical protein
MWLASSRSVTNDLLFIQPLHRLLVSSPRSCRSPETESRLTFLTDKWPATHGNSMLTEAHNKGGSWVRSPGDPDHPNVAYNLVTSADNTPS